jgi:hexokinase
MAHRSQAKTGIDDREVLAIDSRGRNQHRKVMSITGASHAEIEQSKAEALIANIKAV